MMSNAGEIRLKSTNFQPSIEILVRERFKPVIRRMFIKGGRVHQGRVLSVRRSHKMVCESSAGMKRIESTSPSSVSERTHEHARNHPSFLNKHRHVAQFRSLACQFESAVSSKILRQTVSKQFEMKFEDDLGNTFSL